MIQSIRTYIEKHRLLEKDRLVAVGLSGGADSVALLAALVRLGYTCAALHCNFHLRGAEAKRDERFAETFARDTLGVTFYKIDFDTVAYASSHRLSVEMAARELRYRWFEKMRIELGAQAVAVGHHRDDQVETVLMNLIRGTGIRGMEGIHPVNGSVVRPLLEVSREDIEKWLASEGYGYMTDSTNLSDTYTRNFLRLRVIPLLEKLNPSVKGAIARTAAHLTAVGTVYAEAVEAARKRVMVDAECLSVDELMRFSEPATLLYECLRPYGFSRTVAEEVFDALKKESGKQFFSSEYRLVKDREKLLIVRREREELPERTTEKKIWETPGFYRLGPEEKVMKFPLELSWRKIVLTEEWQIIKDKRFAYFDYDKLRFPLILRRWQQGDWFVPFGMTGRKKVSDYLIDRKFSRLEKEQIWLLCSGDAVIWIVGERIDNRFRIDKGTKNVLFVNFSG